MTDILTSIIGKTCQIIDRVDDRLFNGNLRRLDGLKAGDRIGRGSVSFYVCSSNCFALKIKTPLFKYVERFEGAGPLTKKNCLNTIEWYMIEHSNYYIDNPRYHHRRLGGIIPAKVTGIFHYNGGGNF